MIRLDKKNLDVGADEILAFAKVRNEALRLPWFLEYHRQLGVDRFIVVDNNSLDGSIDYLLSQNDVYLFSTQKSLAQSRGGTTWINPILNTYAQGHWTLTLDADELFIYPYIEDINLKELVCYLDSVKAEAMSTKLIDMYGRKAIRETVYSPGEPFLKSCPYFDGEKPKDMRSGVRERLFWRGRERSAKPPYLSKIPLVRWRSGLSFEASTHIIRDVEIAEVTGLLLHFKLFSDFHDRVKEGVEMKQYWQNSAQYDCYLDGLEADPGLTPFYSGSVRFEKSAQLVKMGFMNAPASFTDFVSKHLHSSVMTSGIAGGLRRAPRRGHRSI